MSHDNKTSEPSENRWNFLSRFVFALMIAQGLLAQSSGAATATLVGWSDEGMHETDGSDVSVYSLAAPYSTIHAQLMLGGLLVTNSTGLTVSYQAVADTNGSVNSTSMGKGNFYQYALALYGASLGSDQGLAGFGMPGLSNQPQPMTFDPGQNCFTATGIPITPYDDQGHKNYFPMMRLVARNGSGTVLARTDIVLPVTDEMTCITCHGSGSDPTARPNEGWAWDVDPDKDYKLNILRNHDDHFLGAALYTSTLSQAGYNSGGLFATVTQDGQPVSCLRCHRSNALPGSGIDPVTAFTLVMHLKHSFVYDPDRNVTLDQVPDSGACFRCHAGPENRALRGAHHHLASTNGTLTMSCQSCHGKMSALGRIGRQGWLEEPACQSCHSGTATSNNGQIRYTSVFDSTNGIRQAVDQTFATQPDTPSTGLSLFRNSHGHGGLACAACHGAAHSEWATSQTNEQVQSQQLQGSGGVLINCIACHTSSPSTITGGPHGLHPTDQGWASGHNDIIGEGGSHAACAVCHGADFRGTVLSLSGIDHTLTGRGTVHYWQGYQTGCYNCHRGPSSDNTNTNGPALASNLATNTLAETPVAIPLLAADPANNPLTFRLISTPAHGKVNLNGALATYFPDPDFLGPDSFTYSAWNGSKDSNLGQVILTVSPTDCVLTTKAAVPLAALPNRSIPFRVAASLTGCGSALTYDWDFGDGTPHGTAPNQSHTYTNEADYSWTLVVTAGGASMTTNGVITISSTLGPPVTLGITDWVSLLELSFPLDPIPISVEVSYDLGDPFGWHAVLAPPFVDFDSVNLNVWIYTLPGPQYFRLRRVL